MVDLLKSKNDHSNKVQVANILSFSPLNAHISEQAFLKRYFITETKKNLRGV